MPFVPRNISAAFVAPEFRPRFGNDISPSAVVAMPEAAMHEDYRAVFRQNNVRLAGQVLSMKPVSVAERMKQRPDPHFRFRVPVLYRRHIATALLRCVNVCHGSDGPCPLPFLYQSCELRQR